MSAAPHPRSRDDFRIAVICAMPLEAEMIQSVFDKDWIDEDIDFGQAEGDQNAYSIGVIGKHNVVLAHMPGMGVTSAATVTAGLMSSYHRIEVAFVAGICGTSPKHPITQKEIVLGDCIISTTVIQYDFGRQYPGLFKKKATIEDTLGRPNPSLRATLAKLQTAPNLKRLSSKMGHHLEILQQEIAQIEYPGPEEDLLFKASYLHTHHDGSEECGECINDAGICGQDCRDLHCEASELVQRIRLQQSRTTRSMPQPELHFGRYGSANTVLKSGADRDRLVKSENIVAFEMEGAGVWDNLPTVIIKSACDYADSHKSKRWQRYAAATAAAGLKSVLEFWKTVDVMKHQDHVAQPTNANYVPGINQSISKADRLIQDYYRSGGRLTIKRLSGQELELERCFINLVLKEKSAWKTSETQRSPFSLASRLQLDSFDDDQVVTLEGLFDTQELPNGKAFNPRRIFIQGRAGVGKTTLCKKIVHNFLEKRPIFFDRLLWIPLRGLKSVHAEYGWQELLQDTFRLTSPEWKEVREVYGKQFYDSMFLGKTLLLFDGLDEISYRWKQDDPMYEFINTILHDLPNVIITSRPQANTFSIESFDLDLETVGFTPDQVGIYMRNCVPDAKKLKRMEDLIVSKPLVQSLLRIPIQLDAFCYTWNDEDQFDMDSSTDSEEGSATMTSLYQSIVIELCRKDLKLMGKADQPLRLSSREIQQRLSPELILLSQLAFQGISNNIVEFNPKQWNRLGNHFYQSNMEFSTIFSTTLEKLSFLRTSDHQEGEETTKRNYHFIHLTFQEFFAATYFAECWQHNKPLTCLQLTGTKGSTTRMPTIFLQDEKYNPRYNIFWRFVAGLLCEKHEIVNFFAQLRKQPTDILGHTHNRLLMYCLNEVVPGQETEVQNLYDGEMYQLRLDLIRETTVEDKPVGRLSLGAETEYPEKILRDLLQNEFDLSYMSTIDIIRRRSVVQAKTLRAIAYKLTDSFSFEVCVNAMHLLVSRLELWTQDILEQIVAFLLASFEDEDQDILRYYIIELGRKGTLPEELINLLVTTVLEHKDTNVRFSALTVLARMISLPENVINTLATIAFNEDESPEIRSKAIDALMKVPFLSGEIIDTLIAFAIQKNHFKMRVYARDALERQDTMPAESIGVLTFIAFENKGWWYNGLAKDSRENLSSLPGKVRGALIEAALDENKHHRVREHAIQVLRGQKSLPEKIIESLKAIVFDKDEDGVVQISALEVLEGQTSMAQESIMALLMTVFDKRLDPRTQQSAAFALRGQEHSYCENIDALVAAIFEDKSKDNWPFYQRSSVTSYAAAALASRFPLPDAATRMLIAKAIQPDEEIFTRIRAIEALGRQEALPSFAIKALVALLRVKEPDIRSSAAQALEEQSLRPSEAIDTLVELFRIDARPEVRQYHTVLSERMIEALIAVIEHGALDIGDDPGQVLRVQSPLLQNVIDVMTAALKAEEWNVRLSAYQSLKKWSCLPEETVIVLVTALEKEFPMKNKIRRVACGVLTRQSTLSEACITRLMTMLADGHYVYDILHSRKTFFHLLKNVDIRIWKAVWSEWLWDHRGMSCYIVEGILYVWADGVRYEISSDPLRTAQLLEAVKDLH